VNLGTDNIEVANNNAIVADINDRTEKTDIRAIGFKYQEDDDELEFAEEDNYKSKKLRSIGFKVDG
jgi:hypothetical protein